MRRKWRKTPRAAGQFLLPSHREVILEGEGVSALFASREGLFPKKEFLLLP
jgi:hypothetical protein